jgi:hypothetical protein
VIAKKGAPTSFSKVATQPKRAKRPAWPRVPVRPQGHAAALRYARGHARTAQKRLADAGKLLAAQGYAPQHPWRLRTECARDAVAECLAWLEEALAQALEEPGPNPAHPSWPEPAKKRRARAARNADEDEKPEEPPEAL